MHQSRTRSAFTLIELMLAIALGMTIVYVAMAGFRVASQSVTIANKLSLENSMLRAGYYQAQIDLDFWTSIDDPLGDSQHQQLRGVGATGTYGLNAPLQVGNAGNPFTPMANIFSTPSTERFPVSTVVAGQRTTYGEIKPRPISSYPSGQQATSTDPWENDVGFDPTLAYSPSDPRTWVRTNLAEKDFSGGNILPYGPYTPVATFGRYGLFSNIVANPTFNMWQVGYITPFNNLAYSPATSGAPPPYLVSYTGSVNHTWYPNQVQNFLAALGYEAMFEYLPPNAIYEFYMSYTGTPFQYGGAPLYPWNQNGGDASNGGLPMDGNGLSRLCTQPGWGYWGGFRNGDGNQVTACGMYRETYSTSFGYFNPWAPADPNGEPGIFGRHFMHFDSDYTAYSGTGSTNGGASGLQDLLLHTAFPQPLMPVSPTYWPVVQACVGRLIKNDHHIAVAKINRLDPLTGKISQLSFLGLGTTLRGARQQRNPSGGWANWDDQPGVANDPNLDSPQQTGGGSYLPP